MKKLLSKLLSPWFLCILGFLISAIWLFPSLEIDENFEFLSEELTAPNARFDLHTPEPREGLDFWSRHFLFELAGSDKYSGPEREARLLSRYADVVEAIQPGEQPQASVDTSLGMAIVEINGKPFVTVLPQDCPSYHARLSKADKLQLETEVAYAWRNEIQDDLNVHILKRLPSYLQLYNYIAVLGFFLTGLAHLTVNWASRRFFKKPLWSIKALLWVSYFTCLTQLHPQFDKLANMLLDGALQPLFLFIVTSVTVGLLHHLTLLTLHQYSAALVEHEPAQNVSLRVQQRRRTIEQAAIFLSQVAWVFIGICVYLYALGIDLRSFFAGAGLLGVAIGVMARDIFVDYFNGVNIIIEDQFGVGDWIESNNDSGEVVSFSLRATKIRRSDGGLATVPNSDLRRVKNHSNEWSQVDYQISVSYRTNVDQALALIVEEATSLALKYPEKFLGEPRPLGVQDLVSDGVVLRVLIKTAPLMQWDVRRRLNRRVKRRFDESGIDFAAPRLAIRVRPSDERDAFASEAPGPREEADPVPPAIPGRPDE